MKKTILLLSILLSQICISQDLNQLFKVNKQAKINLQNFQTKNLEIVKIKTTPSVSVATVKQKIEESKTEAIETSKNVRKSIRITTDLINNTLSTANLFLNVASAMRVVSDEEALKINEKSIKIEKRVNNVKTGLTILGAGLTTFLATQNKNNEAITSVGLTVGLNSILNIFSKKREKKNQNSQLDKAVKYVQNKATLLSIHSFLLIKIKSVSTNMVEMHEINSNIREEIKSLDLKNNWKDVEKLTSLVDDVLSLISKVDQFYNIELNTLEKEIEARGNYTIYDEAGKSSLKNLIISSKEARSSWKDVRYFYNDVENTLAQFKEESNDIIDIVQK